jgi:general secretion pathway protein N
MRIRLPLGRTLFFVCALLFALVALLPMRLALEWFALDERGLAAREAEGSVWQGRLSESQFGALPLGDLQAGLRTLPLLLGRARVDLERDEEPDRFVGSATVSRHGFGIDDLSARLPLGSMFSGLPIKSLEMTEVTARFADGACAEAEGLVRATVAGDIGGLALPGGLAGNARCDGTALLLPLTGQTGQEALNLRLFDDGRYEVELAVRPSDDAMRDRLIASGFQLSGSGYALSARGAF